MGSTQYHHPGQLERQNGTFRGNFKTAHYRPGVAARDRAYLRAIGGREQIEKWPRVARGFLFKLQLKLLGVDWNGAAPPVERPVLRAVELFCDLAPAAGQAHGSQFMDAHALLCATNLVQFKTRPTTQDPFLYNRYDFAVGRPMPRRREYANDAARAAAYRKRKKDAAAAAVPKAVQPLLDFLAGLRREIKRRRSAIGCQRQRRHLMLPGPSGSANHELVISLLSLVNYIETELDRSGVLAEVGPKRRS